MANRRSIVMAVGYSTAILTVVILVARVLLGGGDGFVYP